MAVPNALPKRDQNLLPLGLHILKSSWCNRSCNFDATNFECGRHPVEPVLQPIFRTVEIDTDRLNGIAAEKSESVFLHNEIYEAFGRLEIEPDGLDWKHDRVRHHSPFAAAGFSLVDDL